MDWWDETTFKKKKKKEEDNGNFKTVHIAFTPTQHWSGRGVADRNKSLWGSFCVWFSDGSSSSSEREGEEEMKDGVEIEDVKLQEEEEERDQEEEVGENFFFGGDTGYCDAFKLIGDKYGPFTISAIPIGAYMPSWFLFFFQFP